MKHFWIGFEKRATSAGATYRRDLATDDTIHSMQEDNYPEGTYSFFNPEAALPKKGKKWDSVISGSVFFDNSADAVDLSTGGQPARYIGPDTYTLGHSAMG